MSITSFAFWTQIINLKYLFAIANTSSEFKTFPGENWGHWRKNILLTGGISGVFWWGARGIWFYISGNTTKNVKFCSKMNLC